MDLFGMLIWAAVLVSLIIFIIVLVKSFKAWGTLHTVLLSILFVEAWCFLFLTASVAQKRIASFKRHDELRDRVEKLEKEYNLNLAGDPIIPKLDLSNFSGLSNELTRVNLERGRAWRGSQIVQKSPTGVSIQLPARVSNLPVPAPATPNTPVPAPAPADSSLAVDSVVYLFGERISNAGLVPAIYLGEFVVTEVKETVSLRPTTPLTEFQLNGLNRAETCAIYETMPVDSHTAFAAAGSYSDDKTLQQRLSDEELFGRMDKQEIASLLGIDVALADASPNSLNPTDAMKAKVLQMYINDGKRANEQTPPEAIAVQVKFTQRHEETVNAESSRGPLEGGYFDGNGLAIDDRIKRRIFSEDRSALPSKEKTVVFNVNDEAVLPIEAANKLQREGKVTLGPTFVVRPLNDYTFSFRENHRLTVRAIQTILLLNRETAQAERTNAVTREQEVKRGEENSQLKADRNQYGKELAVVQEESSKLESQIEAKKKELSQVYASIVSLHDTLVQRQRALADAINASTAP